MSSVPSLRPAQPALPSPGAGVRSLAHLLIAILAAILSFSLFLAVREGIEDNHHHVLATDHALLAFCHRHQMPGLTEIAKCLAFLGSPPVMVTVAVLACLAGIFNKQIRGAAWTLPVGVIGGGALIQGVKITFQRQRPQDFVPLIRESGYSFPSGHSLIAVVVYGLLGFFIMGRLKSRALRRLTGALTVLLVVMIGVSRVYVGVHYPTDVLAGWSLGVPWLIGCLALHEHLARRYEGAGTPVFAKHAESEAAD